MGNYVLLMIQFVNEATSKLQSGKNEVVLGSDMLPHGTKPLGFHGK